MAYDVFISYSRKDTAIADKICKALDKAGITYFIDRKGINGGMEFQKKQIHYFILGKDYTKWVQMNSGKIQKKLQTKLNLTNNMKKLKV